MKIISLSRSFTEILENFGRASELAGVTDHCPELAGDPARVGSPKSLRFEVIESLHPDLILADARENRFEEIQALQKKYRAVSFDVRSVNQAMEAVRAIGRLTGALEESEGLVSEIAEEYRLCKLEKDLPRVRALILLWNIPLLTVNFDTYISRVIEAGGGLNVFHADPLPEFAIELEDMIEKDPEILFLPTDPFPFKKKDIKRFRQYRILSKIPIELVEGRLFSYFGPATAEALRFFRQVFEKVRPCQPKVYLSDAHP